MKLSIEKDTLSNTKFRKVIKKIPGKMELTYMSIKPRDEIGAEIHPETVQFIRFESGKGKAIIGNKIFYVKDGDAVIIPHNTKHNIINTSKTEDLKLYSIYSPPEKH